MEAIGAKLAYDSNVLTWQLSAGSRIAEPPSANMAAAKEPPTTPSHNVEKVARTYLLLAKTAETRRRNRRALEEHAT